MKILPSSTTSKETPNPSLMSQGVFDDRSPYVCGLRLFYSYFGVVPSLLTLCKIEMDRAVKWVDDNFEDAIRTVHTHDRNTRRSRKVVQSNYIYLLEDGIMIDIEDDGLVAILFQHPQRKRAHQIGADIGRFRRRERMVHNIHFIIDEGRGMRCIEMPNKKPKLELQLHYNDDMRDVHKRLVSKLNSKDENGLVLLHGVPGSGKSTYIRYLIHQLKKRVIFLPSNLASGLDSPAMLTFLVEYPNSVLIIEDAEELIRSRENVRAQGISALLNLTDGILGESLNMQVVCTFNTRLANIDSALLRKGRLIQAYEFGPLTLEKSKRLATHLGKDSSNIHTEMTLAEVYYLEEANRINNAMHTKRIGFSVEAG